MNITIEAPAPSVEWAGEEPEDYTAVRDEARVMRDRLRQLARKGSPAQRDAAGLLTAHGEDALVILLRRAPLVAHDRRVRYLLERAGCSAGEQVEMFGVDRSRVEIEDPLPF